VTEDWEITAGDFGDSYLAVVKDLDLSACTATIKVWSDSMPLIDDKACGAVSYDEGEEESYLYFDVEDGDIPSTAAVSDIVRYNVAIKFVDDGYNVHSLKFVWIVHPAPP